MNYTQLIEKGLEEIKGVFSRKTKEQRILFLKDLRSVLRIKIDKAQTTLQGMMHGSIGGLPEDFHPVLLALEDLEKDLVVLELEGLDWPVYEEPSSPAAPQISEVATPLEKPEPGADHWSLEQAAKYLGKSESTLRKHCSLDKSFPVRKAGGKVFFLKEELDAWSDVCNREICDIKNWMGGNRDGIIALPY